MKLACPEIQMRLVSGWGNIVSSGSGSDESCGGFAFDGVSGGPGDWRAQRFSGVDAKARNRRQIAGGIREKRLCIGCRESQAAEDIHNSSASGVLEEDRRVVGANGVSMRSSTRARKPPEQWKSVKFEARETRSTARPRRYVRVATHRSERRSLSGGDDQRSNFRDESDASQETRDCA
jgi:hypothetical protein